ncbi:MAG: hypothetical protein LBT83_05945 [Tannerella sp.]|nr:hypothetical protein [Tannerella sp.]
MENRQPRHPSEYIHVFELNYHKTFSEHSISATLFHRNRSAKIERLRIPYKSRNDYKSILFAKIVGSFDAWNVENCIFAGK